ncbi:MAG: zinc ribbon domain-containing protein [Chloroflexi bacterium]|nr:zinc ribbon domain-containing protein [Chloroflexota bacterium]
MQDRGFALILKAIDVSLDVRKLGVAVVGLAATLGVAAFLSFLGSRTGDAGLVLFTLLAALVMWVGISLVYGAVTRLSYLHLTQGNPGSWRDALGYALGHLVSLMFTGLVLAFAVLGVFLVEVIVLLLGRIPYLGELIASAAFLPLTVLNAFVLLVITVGSWLIYPTIAAEGTGVVGTIQRVVGLVRRSPGQVAAYIAIAIIAVGFASWIIFGLGYGGAALTAVATMIGAGSRIGRLFGIWPRMGGYMSPYGMGWTPYRAASLPFTMYLAQLIYAIGIAGLVAIVAAFPVVFLMSAATATYLNVAEPKPPVATQGNEAEVRCPQCGSPAQKGQKFCSNCGAAL